VKIDKINLVLKEKVIYLIKKILKKLSQMDSNAKKIRDQYSSIKIINKSWELLFSKKEKPDQAL
jgi:hypothetical protein